MLHRWGSVGILLLSFGGCSGSEFSAARPSSSADPPAAGAPQNTGSGGSSGTGASGQGGGGRESLGGNGGTAGGAGNAGDDASGGIGDANAGSNSGGSSSGDGGSGGSSSGDGGSGGDTAGDCQGKLESCECAEGRCSAGLGCTVDNLCIAMPTPLAHWPFTDNAADATGNDYNGLALNDVGFENDSARFNGNDSFVDISSFAATFKSIATAMTVYIRLRATSYASDPLLFGLGNVGEEQEGNGFWFMVIGGKAAIDTETGAGFDNLTFFGESLATATWLDLVFVVDGATADYYLNGELAESKDFAALDTSATHMQIGGWMTPENVLDGVIDDVQVFDIKLSHEQIEALPSTRDRTYER
jgi:hypothetical protein